MRKSAHVSIKAALSGGMFCALTLGACSPAVEPAFQPVTLVQRPVFDDRDCIPQEVDQRYEDFADKAYRYFEENLAEKYQGEIKPSYLVLCSSGFYLFSFYLTRSTHPELIFKMDEEGRVVDFGTYPEYESLPAKLSQRVGENICI